MNTLARSLDALIGPAKNKRGRKRDIASIEDDEDGPERKSRAIYKRLRIMTALDDAEQRGKRISARPIASFASTQFSVTAGPIKQINQLAAHQQPLEMLDFSRLEARSLPPSMNTMITNIRRVAKGINTIPMSLKAQVLEQDPDLSSDDDVWQLDVPLLAESTSLRPGSNADSMSPPELSNALSNLPLHPDPPLSRGYNRPLYLSQAEMIVEQARECHDNDDLEAGWNSQVHGPLLLLACNTSQHRAKVKSANLAHARLLARPETDSQAIFGSKMVDFGIYLQNSNRLKAAYRDIQPEADGQSRYFNHTDCEQIARKPLVISIESERAGQSGSQADLKLSVWAKSHLDRLSELCWRTLHSEDRTIWLPLLKVVGPAWYLLLARGDYNDSGELSSTRVYSRHQLGDVTTYHGFFQVLAALLELIDWAETFYRPWFEDWVSNDQEADVVGT